MPTDDITKINSLWGFLAYALKTQFKKIVVILICIAVIIISITVGFSIRTPNGVIEKPTVNIKDLTKEPKQ